MTIEIRFPQWEETWLIYVIRKGLSFFLFFCWQRILDEFFVLPSFKRMEEYPNHSSFPTSFVSGRMKPMQLFGSPFSSPSPTWDDAPKVDKEAWWGSCSSGSLETLSSPRFWGSRSLFRDCRRRGFWNSGKILLTFRGGRSLSMFERVSDGRVDEIVVYETFFETGFRGGSTNFGSRIFAIYWYFSFTSRSSDLVNFNCHPGAKIVSWHILWRAWNLVCTLIYSSN